MTSVILLLGGNLGLVEQTFAAVCGDLECEVGYISSRSELFRTPSWGFEAADFLNQALILSTPLSPEELLDATQRIEERRGRNRLVEQLLKLSSGERYSSRAIDIDIIFYGDEVIETPRLSVPHPLMSEREFVLKPIAQIAPRAIHPQTGRSVEEMLNDLMKQ